MSVRAGGKVGGVRYAASSKFVSLDLSSSRFAGGKIGGVRHAGRGFNFASIPVFGNNKAWKNLRRSLAVQNIQLAVAFIATTPTQPTP